MYMLYERRNFPMSKKLLAVLCSTAAIAAVVCAIKKELDKDIECDAFLFAKDPDDLEA